MNFDRLLGGMVQSAVSGALGTVFSARTSRNWGTAAGRQQRHSSFNKAKLGMGALGLAVAAFEHFQRGGAGSPMPSSAPPAPGSTPPPPPSSSGGPDQPDSLLLLRAMIAAAYADGLLDESERKKIAETVADLGLSAEEQGALNRELSNPLPVAELLRSVSSRAVAEQFYLVSLLPLQVDSSAEQHYLKQLEHDLRLDPATVTRLRSTLD